MRLAAAHAYWAGRLGQQVRTTPTTPTDTPILTVIQKPHLEHHNFLPQNKFFYPQI
jgi:hypothetical protein